MHGRAEQARQTYSSPWAQHRLSPDATFLTRHFPARYFSRPTLVAPADVAATQENLNIVLDVLFDAPHRLTGGDLAAFGRALGYDEVRLAFACAAELHYKEPEEIADLGQYLVDRFQVGVVPYPPFHRARRTTVEARP